MQLKYAFKHISGALILEKIQSYFNFHWKEISASIVLGLSAAFWILPEILDKEIVQHFFRLDLSSTLLLFVLIEFLFLSFSFRPFHSFLVRWKNNFSLTNPPFTFFDGIYLSSLSLILSTIAFRETLLNGLKISSEMEWFLWVFF